MTTNTDNPELAPCPFCGAVPVMQSHTQEDEMDEGRFLYFIECANPKCLMGLVSTGGPSKTPEGAATCWNSRVSASPAAPVETGGFTCDCCGRNMEVRINGKFCNECAGYRAPAAPVVDAMWEALKAECCKNPAEAKTVVFVGEEKFKKALAPFAAASPASTQEDAEHVSEL